MARVVFITGTGTNVGKTVVTGLLISHALSKGIKARAIKPISTGSRSDGEMLFELQNRKLPLAQINPLHFTAPVTPLLAARMEEANITMSHLMALVLSHESECDLLLVEGAGGLLSPLGHKLNLGDLIKAIGGEVIVVAQNRLGVLNEVLLTVEALAARGRSRARIVLANHGPHDESSRSNKAALEELEMEVLEIQQITDTSPSGIKNAAQAQAGALEMLLAPR